MDRHGAEPALVANHSTSEYTSGMSDNIDRIDEKEAANAVRLIVQRWRDCTKIAGIGRKMADKGRAVDAVSGLAAVIIESALWLSQGDDEDRYDLAKRLAKHLCGDQP